VLTNSSILIADDTGFFGHSVVPLTFAKFNPRRLVIYSRNKMKQWELSYVAPYPLCLQSGNHFTQMREDCNGK